MEDLSTFQKKLLYKSTHRGSKEMDLILGKFAHKYLSLFNDDELVMLEAILEMDDNDIYQYALNKKQIPESLNNRVFTLLKDYTLL